MEKTVVELFCGVGGFRVGLNQIKKIKKNGLASEKNNFKFLWANQWEPSTKAQDAFLCYKTRFGLNENEFSNENICYINKKVIPNHTLLVGGFPCQDYSVARSLSNEKGIQGKKGVLWWQINEILSIKKPPFVLLENVDRLLISPSKQRGRDFGIMLYSFLKNGYGVEWRVINAAEYGHVQRRKRVFIFAFKKTTNYFKNTKKKSQKDFFLNGSIFSKSFKILDEELKINYFNLKNDFKKIESVSDNFSFNFLNSGYMIDGKIYTAKVNSIKNMSNKNLKNILEKEKVDSKYYLNEIQINKMKHLRDKKKIKRISKEGKKYFYSEGKMTEYDDLNRPARTMLTSEGTINRSSHIIKDPYNGKIRHLTPIECERLNEFPDNWTNMLNDKRRYFIMGNALVCGIIEKIGKEISNIIDLE